jgi:hypothetical protein
MPSKGKPKGSATSQGATALLSGPGPHLLVDPVAIDNAFQAALAAAVVEKTTPGPEPVLIVSVATVEEQAPLDLEQLQAVKEWLRQEQPKWYPDFRDTFGHTLTQKIAPELAGLGSAELGLPPNTDSDRLQREKRALAFARAYLMASAGDVDGLRKVSDDLAYWWNDRMGGKLIPLPPIDANNPAPWVHAINQLRSRHTDTMDGKFKPNARYRNFVQAIKDWTDGLWKPLRAAAKTILAGGHGGEHHAKANELIQAIQAAPNNAPRLWRKESKTGVAQRLGVAPEALLHQLQPRVGQVLKQDIVSTSDKPNVWSGGFVWEIEPGAQAVHAYPVSHHPSEHEWITAGSFRVLEVAQLSDGGVKVRVEQTGVF